MARIVYDCLFVFANGDTLQVEFLEARDGWVKSETQIAMQLKPDETTVEELTVHRDHLNYSRLIRRELPDDA